MVNTGKQHDDERATRGRRLDVRPLTTAEREHLQRLERQRIAANLAFDKELVRLYLVGVSQAKIAEAIGISKYAIGNVIRRRRQWLSEDVIPRRRRTGVHPIYHSRTER